MAVFRPVRASESVIVGLAYNEGYLYFATDTGKIFLDANGERKTMGGAGASIYYAQALTVTETSAGTYLLMYGDLEDTQASVKPSDLIINKNGSFYKVLDANKDTGIIECELLAISGTGGGGTGEGPGTGGSQITLSLVGTFPISFIYGQDYYVTFKSEAKLDEVVTYTVRVIGDSDNLTQNYTALSGENYDINIGKLLFRGNNGITITVTGENSGTTSLKYSNRITVNMALQSSSNFNPREVVNGVCNFKCIPVGQGIKKVLTIYVDGVFAVDREVSTSNQEVTLEIPAQSHGAHEVKAVLSTASTESVQVESEPLVYEIAWSDGVSTAPIIWLPEGYVNTITNYSNLKINFCVWQRGVDTVSTNFYTNGILSTTRNITYSLNEYSSWDVTDYKVGNNTFIISAGTTSKLLSVLVEEDTERDLNIIQSSLVLNLDSAGRSNEEAPSRRQSWSYTNSNGVKTDVAFNNFNWYNNGWILDEDGKSCLRISNGASISIPTSGIKLLTTDSLANSISIELRFKIRNVRNYSTLITKELEHPDLPADDPNNKVITNVETNEGVCGKMYSNMGFCIGTQEAFFATTGNSTLVSARYMEDEIINVTFVAESQSAATIDKKPIIYMYLNGINSAIATYPSTDTFRAGTNAIVFSSEYCDIDLYKVRVYNTALSSASVVHNYVADEKNVSMYDMNQIVSYVKNVPSLDFELMRTYNASHPEKPLLPYMVIECNESPLNQNELLPFNKGDKKSVNITFVNPYLDYLWETGQITGEAYLKGCPSYTFSSKKEALDVQGTSSQGYPRRNYKAKLKQSDAVWVYTNGPLKDQPVYYYDSASGKYKGSEYEGKTYKKWHMDSSIGESTFCFKADYMESSSSYNTGLASYLSTLYTAHPLELLGYGKDNYRTTVYGFPMLVFQKYRNTANNIFDKNSEYQYIGRYNYNLDKGCDESYGFVDGAESKVKNADGTYRTIEEVAECWEFCNNENTGCSFIFSSKENKPEYAFDYVDTNGNLTVLGNFEYRYSYYADYIDACLDGDAISADDALDLGPMDFSTMTSGQKNEFMLNQLRNLRVVCEWVDSTNTDLATNNALDNPVTYIEDIIEYQSLGANENPIQDFHYWFDGDSYLLYTKDTPTTVTQFYKAVTITQEVTYTNDTAEYRIAKFRNEFNKHLNAEYCYVYFIMTELLHLYDSRGKNMMFASFGPKEEGGDYIWFPIFYDMDTQMGINNSGIPLWDYDAEPTDEDQFSTSSSVLWKNLWTCFSTQIKNHYNSLRKSKKVDYTSLRGYYDFDPAVTQSKAMVGDRPIMAINIDEYFKYISPANEGYIDTSGNVSQSDRYFYCLQGTRALARALYLKNRLNYLDSKWQAGNYDYATLKGIGLASRYDANASGTSDVYIYDPTVEEDTPIDNGKILTNEWPKLLDTQIDFDIRSFLKQYMFLQFDDNQQQNYYCDAINTVNLPMPSYKENAVKSTPNYTQQLLYIGGGEYIADLGDLSLKYFDELNLAQLKRLETLVLGNDNRAYYNQGMTPSSFVIGSDAGSTQAKQLLKKVVLSNLPSLTSNIGITGSEKLEEFRALGTKITGVQLADGVQIKTLHLPNTITLLSLTEPTSLTKILTAKPVDAEGNFVSTEGLYIEDITDADINNLGDLKTLLARYEIIGGSLGYGSYKLLDILTRIKLNAINDADTSLAENYKRLRISLQDVQWSPYVLVKYGEPYDSTKIYYKDNNRFKLNPYINPTDAQWDSDTANGKVYEYIAERDNKDIVDLSILDTFIDSYNEALEEYENSGYTDKNFFQNTNTIVSEPTIPTITGLMYVDNNSTPYDEEELQNYYLQYFPDLQIFCKNISESFTARFVSIDDDGIETLEAIQRYPVGDNQHAQYPLGVVPSRLNYDFVGWSLTPDGDLIGEDPTTNTTNPDLFNTASETLFSTSKTLITFYAVFKIHYYTVTFKNPEVTSYNIDKVQVAAGAYLTEPKILPVSPKEVNLDFYERYKFLGWVADELNSYPESESMASRYLVDIPSIVSENKDREFYACYIKENVRTSVTNEKYFSFIESSYTAPDGTRTEGYTIAPNAEYRNSVADDSASRLRLNGKLTLPTTYNGKPVLMIQNFNGAYTNGPNGDTVMGLTHVFWSGADHLKSVRNIFDNWNSGAFASCLKLVYFQFPSTLLELDAGSFNSTALNFSLVDLASTSLINIKKECFQNLTGNADEIILPGSLKSIQSTAFAYMQNDRGINIVQLGSETDPSQLETLIANAFVQSDGKNVKEWRAYVSSQSQKDTIAELIGNASTSEVPTVSIQIV